ncbi:hypothetical protein [Corynebacterium caspium]|uniref:hypothetical protein n=1 Tax=Corynebacterium caspium TaxID=234828 RepID=UPI0003770C4C|nr:hypothetical protein [Corynebacterium caspium]WKD58904.1 hypothetical protein CCASP_02480 [Corynebacterium caspium DSM 44850]
MASNSPQAAAYFTKWRRHGQDAELLLGDTEEVVAIFGMERATVAAEPWQLSVDSKSGATATLPDGTTYRLRGDLSRDKSFAVDLAGRSLDITNENAANYVVLDAAGRKIAQFTGANRGVRNAILERDIEDGAKGELTLAELAALSWFARLLLESRLGRVSTALLATLVALSIIAILAFLV